MPADQILRRRDRIGRRLAGRPTPGTRLLRADRAAGAQQLDSPLHTDQPRQALRPAVARDEAEVDLGLAGHQLPADHSGVAAHRQLRPSAEEEAMGLDLCEHAESAYSLERVVLAFDPVHNPHRRGGN